VRVIYASLDEFNSDGPKVRTIWGHDVSIESAQGDLVRLQDKIDAYLGQLSMRIDTAQRRRLRAKLDALEREHDFLFRQVNPPAPNRDEAEERIPNRDAVVDCRSSDCRNQLTKSLAFQTSGFCPPCWKRATKTSTERAD
jgi:hypothetical protein